MPPGAAVEPLALFRTLAVHPELMSRMRPLGSGILNHGEVPPRDREIVLHRTCARAGAEYEWGVHAVAFGGKRRPHRRPARVHRAPGQRRRRVLVRAATPSSSASPTSCTTPTRSPTSSGRSSRARYTDQQLLELIVTAGWYRTLAYVINAARIPPEPWAARFPAS